MNRHFTVGAVLFLVVCSVDAPTVLANERADKATLKELLDAPTAVANERADKATLKELLAEPKPKDKTSTETDDGLLSISGAGHPMRLRTAQSTESPTSKTSPNNFAGQPYGASEKSTTVKSSTVKKASAQEKSRADREPEVAGGYAYLSIENTGVGAAVRVELNGEEVATVYPQRQKLVKVNAGSHELRVIDAEESRDELPNWRDFDVEFETSRFEVLTIRLARAESEREALQVALMHDTTLLRSVGVPAR